MPTWHDENRLHVVEADHAAICADSRFMPSAEIAMLIMKEFRARDEIQVDYGQCDQRKCAKYPGSRL